MKLGIMQPYFMPYIGYFQLMKAVDKYVVYDDVNYIKGGWVSRNHILVNGEKKMFTIILKGATPNKLFNEIEVGDDFCKLRKTLWQNYHKAPCFSECMALFERIVSFSDRNLSRFITNSFREILCYLNIDTEILVSSDLKKNMGMKGEDKIIHLCHLFHADAYYNAIGGQKLYGKDKFRENGIELHFLKTGIVEYKQFEDHFIPDLSLIDILMFNSPEEVNQMLDQYELE